MDKLWAPWRINYVTKIGKKAKRCVFCNIVKEKKDKKNFIVTRTKHAYAVLNIYPYNNGHMLIIPNSHVSDLGDLKKEEMDDLMDLLEATKKLLEKKMNADGYNIGINLGRAAGAGFPKHVHIHLVPRWQGDVNFMPVTGQTKVISQSLRALYELLTKKKRVRKK
ncbi:MAG: HIT domain-containing protein [Candidatus Omnitrophica bacterium]|nr:HIT domain-containing protein [Candidatus Omnitrophota bacterium]